MKKDIWSRRTFTDSKDHFPPWPCPTCRVGHLQLESLNKEETSQSIKDHNTDGWEVAFVNYRFSANLRCGNPKCEDLIISIGTGHVTEYVDEFEHTFENIFVPKYFIPCLHFFEIPNTCPEDVTQAVLEAFSLFWIDYSSSSNKIRIAVERLMDRLKVKKWEKIPGKTKERKLELHRRIQLYSEKEPKIAEHLLAIKWIGNAGVHGQTIKESDVLMAFEILEYCLENLYNNNERRLSELTAKINKKRGPISKK